MRDIQFYRPRRRIQRRLILIGAGALVVLVLLLLLYARLFGPMRDYAAMEEFIVNPDTPVSEVAEGLKENYFIRSTLAFRIAFALTGEDEIIEGGYSISRSQDMWTIAEAFARPPYLTWVIVPPGLRKEEIANILARKLKWTDEQKEEWVRVDTAPSPTQTEGVYFGDTYLIASDQPTAQVAKRLRGRFEEVFAPYAARATARGLSWNEVITLASLIERESGKKDKALVSGILHNRLDIGMALQVDATLQYIRGEEGNWWPAPRPEDKQLDSPFNTYKHAGLPPHAIANPSLDSIIAALEPEATDCLYYLHGSDGLIHCSETYAGQKANVNRYLR
ncbi:MAG TPA: endolytic transglycosylase MltG [Candidatus Paceibacterota bacterium]|nr:endolytic transglycosylase MltG [Candidatus Paceibacterota bacterium]